MAVRTSGRIWLPVALVMGALAWYPMPATSAEGSDARVLVTTFESDASQPRTYWLGEGASILVADELIAAGADALTRDQRVEALDELHLPAASSLSRATVIRVAELAGVSHVVLGNVTLDNATVTVRVRDLVMNEGRLLPEIVETGPIGGLFGVCARAARRLAEGMGVRPAAANASPATSEPVEAFEAYVKGLLAEKPETRERLLHAAVERAPAYDRALLGLWDVQTDLGHHQAALESARAVPAESPRYARARFAAALSLIELQQYDDAYATLSALSGSHNDAGIFNNLGVVQIRRGPTPQTGLPVAYFNKAAELDPDDPDLFFNLGYAYLLDRDSKTAVYWLRQAVRRAPADGDAHYVLAAALQASGSTAEATRERELARRLSSQYEEWERRRQAGDVVPRGLERIKESLDPVHLVRFDRAVIAAAQRDQREMVDFYVARAHRFYGEERDGEAVAELRRALFLAPYDANALVLLARVHLRNGRPGEASDAARVALWSVDTAAGHVVLAQALLELKDVAGARAEAERALSLDSASADAKALLAKLPPGGSR
jgi:tetratricopeptide (TPR) repeat protein